MKEATDNPWTWWRLAFDRHFWRGVIRGFGFSPRDDDSDEPHGKGRGT